MKFKNYEDYKAQREALYNAAEELLQNGDVEGANARMEEVEKLDNAYEAFATAQANLAAMQGRGTAHPDGVVGSAGNAAGKDVFDTDEYKNAFMNLVCRGEALPIKYKDAIVGKLQNAVTTVTETTAVIPTTVMKEFIRELKAHGELYARVRKTNVQGGVEIPILSLCPTASWVADGSASTDQKVTANTKVSFSYYGLECKIAQSLIANVVDFAEFTEMFVPLAVEAIIAALDKGIIAGTGSGQMLGITKDSRVPAGNVIEMTAEDVASWKAWKEKVFAKMKKAYRNGVFVFAQGTFDAQIDGMVDSTGQPIARVNYGIAEGETYRFGGKEVITTEEDVLESFA
ncbi:MAG TPA: phage major capsid protein, partial [Tyzzerella sp.]|nr:phage major capsid protein [Tyzzerella sp.]